MADYPVSNPTRLERLLFDAGLVVQVPLEEIYDIKAGTTVQRSWQQPAAVRFAPDVHDPNQWNDKLHACMRGEFFAHALRSCTRVLDVGCGEGWPSLYLARTVPQVVGIDLSPKHVELARNTAGLMGFSNVQFEVGHIEDMHFDTGSFDGVCFGGNVFTYSFDTERMVREIRRVLTPGGVFALEQWPVNPHQTTRERIHFFIDGGPPILHYGAHSGLHNRSYFIYLRPDSPEGRRLIELATRLVGELPEEHRRACEEIKQQIEQGQLEVVAQVKYSGEDRSLAAAELPAILERAGFIDFASWALPDAVAFARSLDEDGVLAHLQQQDLIPCLRALVKSARTSTAWIHQWVTCRKGH